MSQMGLRYEISEDRDSLIFTLLKENEPLGHVVLDAATLAEFIRGLTAYRELMSGDGAPRREASSAANFTANPAWAVFDGHEGPEGTVVLSLHHPDHGWLSFGLESAQARSLVQGFLERLDEPQTGVEHRKYRH